MQLGALDATVHTQMAGRFGVRGFPTIKFFGADANSAEDAVDYDGGRSVTFFLNFIQFFGFFPFRHFLKS
jgi:protein disulfide-isomerase A6